MVFEDIIQPAVAIFSTFPGWLKFACFLGVAIVSLSAFGFVLDLAQVPHTLFQACTYTTVSDNTRIALYQFAGYEKASRTADIPLFGNTTVDNPCLPCITPRVVIGTAADVSGTNASIYPSYDPNMNALDGLCALYPLDSAVKNRTELLYGASDCIELERSVQIADEVNSRLAYCSNNSQTTGCDFRLPLVSNYLSLLSAGTALITVGNDTFAISSTGTLISPGTVRLLPNKGVCTPGLNLLDPVLLIVGAIMIELCIFAIKYYSSMAGYMR